MMDAIILAENIYLKNISTNIHSGSTLTGSIILTLNTLYLLLTNSDP
jgi:hypothetical protein